MKFEIVITLGVKAVSAAEARLVLIDAGIVDGDVCVDELADGFWDITLDNSVEAETAQEAVATLSDDFRKALSEIDSSWHGLVFQDDDEVVELMAIGADCDTYFPPRPVNEHGQELAGKLSKENLDHQKSHWDRKTGDWTK